MASDPLLARLTRRQLEEYAPKTQPHYVFLDSKWEPVGHGNHRPAPRPSEAPSTAIANLRVITWNIDFMAPQPQARMASALSHLQHLVEGTPTSTAVVILLQELKQDRPLDLDDLTREAHPESSDDLGQIASSGWVQANFHVSDLTTAPWRCSYNSVTLVDRRLAVERAARLPFVSQFNREALLVDMALRAPAHQKRQGRVPVLRLCNVHLDSMAGNPPMRPVQWRGCARYLQDRRHGVVAGVLAGDCNANQTYDESLPGDNGFRDAYVELGGREGDPDGFTWGPQSKGTTFAHKRMDKICFCQDGGDAPGAFLRPRKLEKIGAGVMVEDEAARKGLEEAGFFGFVTDHYGLMADFDLGDAWRFVTEP